MLQAQLGYLNDVVADSIEHELTDRMEPEFPHNIRAVSFGGFDAQIQSDSDFLTAFTLGEQLHYLPFTRGKAVRIGGWLLLPIPFFQIAVEHHRSDLGGEIGSSPS